jgi:hypothetical protein
MKFPPLQFLDFFLKGNLSLEPVARPRPNDWLPDQAWQDTMGLAELAASKEGQDGAVGWFGVEIAFLYWVTAAQYNN